jgi:hypothetical protein
LRVGGSGCLILDVAGVISKIRYISLIPPIVGIRIPGYEVVVLQSQEIKIRTTTVVYHYNGPTVRCIVKDVHTAGISRRAIAIIWLNWYLLCALNNVIKNVDYRIAATPTGMRENSLILSCEWTYKDIVVNV